MTPTFDGPSCSSCHAFGYYKTTFGCSSRYNLFLSTYKRLMPKDLPGLYWDENRSRYFPLSSRTKQAPPPTETITSYHTKETRGFFDATNEKARKCRPRKSVLWRANETKFITESYTQRMRISQSVLFVDLLIFQTSSR